MFLPALLILGSALPFGPPIDSATLATIAGNGAQSTALTTSVMIPGAAMSHVERATNATGAGAGAGAGLAIGDGRSSIAVLLRVDRFNMDGRQIAGPLTIALRRDNSAPRNDLR